MRAPVLRYPGSKWRLADWIIAHMPPHRVYVEPYFGSGAVFFCKPSAKLETINDVNGHVVNLFRVMRENPEDLAAAVVATPWSREEYELSYERGLDVLDPVEAARRFLVRTWQGHGSAADQYRNGWRAVADVEKGPPRVPYRQWQNLPDRVLAAAVRLKNVQIECRPALDVMRGYWQPRILLYCDPPYVLSSISKSRNGRKIYDDVMTDEEHEEMLEVLAGHPGYVMLSGYASQVYDDALAGRGWGQRSITAATQKGDQREEVLWLNPAAIEALDGRLF